MRVQGLLDNRLFPSTLLPKFPNESSCETDFDLHENGCAGDTHFHTNRFARRLVLKQKQMANSIILLSYLFMDYPFVEIFVLAGFLLK